MCVWRMIEWKPSIDQAGRVCMAPRRDRNIYDTDGQNVAFVSGDGVFNYDGAHVGWWLNGHIRDRSGCVALSQLLASNLGV